MLSLFEVKKKWITILDIAPNSGCSNVTEWEGRSLIVNCLETVIRRAITYVYKQMEAE